MSELIKKELEKSGLKMSKKISSGGIFSSSTYDNRTVYNLDDVYRLNKLGFGVEEDAGMFVFNAIITNEEEKNKQIN